MAYAMQVGFRTVDGIRVRWAGNTDLSAPSILLTSPRPESVYASTPIWPALAKVARVVAVDLPDFGRSERRDDLLSPRAMGGFLVRFIAEWGPDKPHVVAPDGRPSAKLVVVEAGHFVWEERADEYASLIADWVAGEYRAAARGSTAAVMSPGTDGGNDELQL